MDKILAMELSLANTKDLIADLEREQIYCRLTSLGQHFPLSLSISPQEISAQLEKFKESWRIYNPKKVGYKRYGLSITSLDGGLGGIPDLTSIHEYNGIHGTSLNELSFRTLTPVYEGCPALQQVIAPFLPFLGRSHFLKLMTGGFFPYHRDALSNTTQTFRIFVPLFEHSHRDFIFLLGRERIDLEPGRAYFINTRMEHALFSLDENSLHLVLNVALSAASLNVVHQCLFST